MGEITRMMRNLEWINAIGTFEYLEFFCLGAATACSILTKFSYKLCLFEGKSNF